MKKNKNSNMLTSLQFDKEKRKRKKTYATFIIAFLSFSLVLAAVSFLILLKSVNYKLSNLVDRKTTATTGEVSSESETYLQKYSGNANVLAVVSNSDKKLDFFGVINLNMDNKQISVSSLDNSNEVSFDGKSGSFSDIYSSGGALGLSQAVEKCYGIKIDRFFDITETNFRSVFAYLGDVVISSPEKISYKGKDFVLNLEAGEQSVTGETILSYYKYLDANGRGALTCEIIDYLISNGKLRDTQAVFDNLINLMNTNISVKDYSDVSDTANAFINDISRKRTVVKTLSEVTGNG